MSIFQNLRQRNEALDHIVLDPSIHEDAPDGTADAGVGADAEKTAHAAADLGSSNEDPSRLSLEAREEREILAHGNEVTKDAALGVRKAEAAALAWSKTAVVLTYAWIWVCFFMLALQSSIMGNVTPYAYSAFSTAPQLATANVLASIVGGVLKLPIAKVLNVWGRAEGFFVFLAVYLLGMVVLAACGGPNGYAAGYVLYWIGYDALYFIMDVFIADTSGLRNRAFAFAFVTTPFICTAFTGSLAAQSFVTHASWRWAIGAFCIIQFAVFTPLGAVFKYYQRKAERMGLYVPQPSGRTAAQSVLHYVREFDIVGAFLLMAAWVLFLLPFSLVSNNRAQYQSATFIAMVVLGLLLFPVFALWEKYGATTHFIRWELFRKRTVVGACAMAAILYYSFYAWDLNYYYFVMVVYDLDITKTGYMTQIYNVGSCFAGALFGVYVRYTRHFKHACLFFAVPLMILASGLMIHFRGQHSNIGYIIMCQIFYAFAGGILVIGMSMAVMAAADRDGVPLMLSLIYLSQAFGGAIGQSVAQSIYINTFPQALQERLPAALRDQAYTIFADGGVKQAANYPVGSPARDAIDYAWGQSQKYNCISSTALLSLAILAVMAWKNYSVDRKQVKGNVL